MSKLSTLTPLAAVLAVSVAGLAHAVENPFALKPVSGIVVADAGKEGNCGANKDAMQKEGNCGANKAKMKKEGKCGEGKCGAKRKAAMEAAAKAGKEGNCGATKMKKEGSCGAGKMNAAPAAGTDTK